MPEIQALLDDDTVLLEYQLAEGSYAWAVTSGSLASVALGKGEEIESLARRLHQGLDRHATACRQRHRPGAATGAGPAPSASRRAAAAQLSEKVLGPIPPPRGKRLAIVADGALHYVPFAALPAPRAGAAGRAPGQPLRDRQPASASGAVLLLRHQPPPRARLEDVAVVRRSGVRPRGRTRGARSSSAGGRHPRGALPSAPGLLRLRRQPQPLPPGRTMSAGSLPRLEYTRELAEAALEACPRATRFKAVDFAANRQAALSPEPGAVPDHRLRHPWAGQRADPELSGIALSMVDESGSLRTGSCASRTFYNLKLNADLVVLGACETGLGKEVRGEGLIGLSRGFMYAGAPRLLASLWKVDEEATMALLREFHGALRRGQPFPAALRDAQQRVRQQPRWSSPYFWAGFVLQGEWRGPDTRNE